MKKFCVEIRTKDVPKLIDTVSDCDGFATIAEPIYGQYCTRYIEVELPEDELKEFYTELKLRGIRNYLKEVA